MTKTRRRTLSIDPDLDERLQLVCKAFGVNPHAYILNKIGEAVVKDGLMINSQNNSDDVYAAIHTLFAGISAENEKLKEVSNG